MLRIPCSTEDLHTHRPRRLGLVPLLVSVVVFCAAGAGCFVADELDRADELMDHHSERSSHVAAAPPEQNAFDEALSVVESARHAAGGLWDSLAGPSRSLDPNPIVDCRLQGSQAFVVESDCLARGGWVRP